jgi:hypothetical protein
MAIEIAQQPSSIVVNPKEYLHLIHGDAGIGKTTWCSQIDGHYFAKCEEGTKGVQVYGSTITSWPDFLELCRLIVEQKATNWKDVRPIDVIIIDTLDRLFDYCGMWVAENVKFMDKGVAKKYDRIENVPWGKGYAEVRELILNVVKKLMSFGFGVVLLAHTKERTVQWRGQDLTSFDLSISPTSAQEFVGACDAVGYATLEETIERNAKGDVERIENGRWLYWQPTFLRRAKHRLENFPERTPMNNDLTKGPYGYQQYAQVFQQVAEAKAKATLNVLA